MAELTMLARDVPPDLVQFFEPVPFAGQTDVFTIPTQSTSFAHFATFPQKLVERCVLAGCPPRVCERCGAPWERCIEASGVSRADNLKINTDKALAGVNECHRLNGKDYIPARLATNHWRPTCSCEAPTRAGVVLDPFLGSGTTALVSRRLGRHYVGCDLNPDYVALAKRRLAEPFTKPLDTFAAPAPVAAQQTAFAF